MPLFAGEQRIARLYRGATPIARAYRGADKVFDTVLPTVTFVDNAFDAANTATPNFGTLDFGAGAGLSRVVVALLGGAASLGVSSLNVSGDSSPVLIDSIHADDLWSFLYVANPGGTSGSVSLTWNKSASRAGIGIFRLNDLASATPFHSAKGSVTNAAANSVSLNIPQDGLAVATAAFNIAGGFRHGGACDGGMSAQTGRSISIDDSGANIVWSGLTERFDQAVETVGSNSESSLVAASFR